MLKRPVPPALPRLPTGPSRAAGRWRPPSWVRAEAAPRRPGRAGSAEPPSWLRARPRAEEQGIAQSPLSHGGRWELWPEPAGPGCSWEPGRADAAPCLPCRGSGCSSAPRWRTSPGCGPRARTSAGTSRCGAGAGAGSGAPPWLVTPFNLPICVLQLKCGNCGEVSEKWQYLRLMVRVPL